MPRGLMRMGRVVQRTPHQSGDKAGFTLLELLMVIAMLGILAVVAAPVLSTYRERAQVAAAIAGIRVIEKAVVSHYIETAAYPMSLADVGLGSLKDPWGNPFQYLVIAGLGHKAAGKARKDRFLVPINSDFDLYSKGPDGMSTGPLTAKISLDDIIRANDGRYVGRAAGY